MHVVIGIVCISFVQILSFNMEASEFIESTDIIRVYPYLLWLGDLYTLSQIKLFGEKELYFGGIVYLFVPFFLISQSRTIVESAF